MYQARARHVLSPLALSEADYPEQILWDLYLAVGDYWQLPDDEASHRLRFNAFLENRVALNPLYRDYYATAADVLSGLIAEHGAERAYAIVFSDKLREGQPSAPSSPLELVQRYVANEFVAFRLALGGFRAFGALNYRGYFGGANIAGEPVPYRTADGEHHG